MAKKTTLDSASIAAKQLYNEPCKLLLILKLFCNKNDEISIYRVMACVLYNFEFDSLTFNVRSKLHPSMISWIVLLHHNQPCLVHVCKKEEFAYLDKARPSNKVIDLPYLQMCTHYSLQALNGWKRPDLATNQLNSVSACRRGKSDIKPVIITSLVVRQHRVVYWTEYAWPQT